MMTGCSDIDEWVNVKAFIFSNILSILFCWMKEWNPFLFLAGANRLWASTTAAQVLVPWSATILWVLLHYGEVTIQSVSSIFPFLDKCCWYISQWVAFFHFWTNVAGTFLNFWTILQSQILWLSLSDSTKCCCFKFIKVWVYRWEASLVTVQTASLVMPTGGHTKVAFKIGLLFSIITFSPTDIVLRLWFLKKLFIPFHQLVEKVSFFDSKIFILW